MFTHEIMCGRPNETEPLSQNVSDQLSFTRLIPLTSFIFIAEWSRICQNFLCFITDILLHSQTLRFKSEF